MKTTAYYPVFTAATVDGLKLTLEHLEKNQALTVAHHFTSEALDYYVMKDASGNSVDWFHLKMAPQPSGFFGLRMNVDNFAEGEKYLLAHGYEVMFPAEETESAISAVYKNKGCNPNIVLFQHKHH